ncbi:MAG: NAD kinase [Prevotellaceae bacterium]|jgi:NAD+ kinase|nr:NAD kinase [Prevotellaceae bacterium]
MKIIIFGTQFTDTHIFLLKKIIEFLTKHNIEILYDALFFDLLVKKKDFEFLNKKNIADSDCTADMAISFGGDGTFLATALKIGSKNIPILGVNAGRLGFLADVSETDIDSDLQAILNGNHRIEERTVLHLEIVQGRKTETFFALNDVSVLKKNIASMISINLNIDGEFVNTYQSDGLIISTPTGSTAYSLSVGGPILTPDSENFILVPVAPHSLAVRPLVIRNTCKVVLKVESRSGNYLVSVDSRSFQVKENAVILIRKADYKIKSIQPQNHSFFNTLRNKLMWGADVRK